MRYMTGASFDTGDGWTKVELELEQGDLELAAQELGLNLDRLDLNARYLVMAAKAEVLLAFDMMNRGSTTAADDVRTAKRKLEMLQEKLQAEVGARVA